MNTKQYVGDNLKGSLGIIGAGATPNPFFGPQPANQFVGRYQDFSGSTISLRAQADKMFTTQITNTDAADHEVCLFPGFYDMNQAGLIIGKSGQPVEAILKEGLVLGTNQAGLRVDSENKTYDDLLGFFRFSYGTLLGVMLQCSLPSQLSQSFFVKKIGPFNELGSQSYNPSTRKTSQDMDPTRVEIPFDDMQIDNNTVLTWRIKASAVVSVTYCFGPIYNIASEVSKVIQQAMAGKQISFSRV